MNNFKKQLDEAYAVKASNPAFEKMLTGLVKTCEKAAGSISKLKNVDSLDAKDAEKLLWKASGDIEKALDTLKNSGLD